MAEKILLAESKRKFDLKFLIVGSPGAGKTHLCGTYTKGPVHLYMFDPGGEKTLFKLMSNRPETSPITISKYPTQTTRFKDFWKDLQADAHNGFFDEMAEKKGLIVIDSFTSISNVIIKDIAKDSKRDLKSTDNSKMMRIQDWGVVGAWLNELSSAINELPCAVVATAHIHTDKDTDNAVLARVPNIAGKLRYTIGMYFDEVYLIESRLNGHITNFKETKKFEAKTRTFDNKSVKNLNLDILAEAYINNHTTIEGENN